MRALAVAGVLAMAGASVPVAAQDPLPVAAHDSSADNRLASIMRGLAHSMASSSAGLAVPGHRLQATRALDDARRIARVLRDLAPADAAVGTAGLDAVERARHALQNGDPHTASGILRGASAQLAQRAERASLHADARVAAADEGKLVINAEGRRIGRLQRVLPQHGASDALLRVGGVINLFGFIDTGYHQVTVPTDRLLAGHRMVVLTSIISPEQVAQLPAYAN